MHIVFISRFSLSAAYVHQLIPKERLDRALDFGWFHLVRRVGSGSPMLDLLTRTARLRGESMMLEMALDRSADHLAEQDRDRVAD